jgi:hypothetical protein
VVEFQKRGLPHAHMLIKVSLKSTSISTSPTFCFPHSSPPSPSPPSPFFHL